jgi:GntR family transcriptional regulator, transcriptional repressor for pyruvate dehydrogenase complex
MASRSNRVPQLRIAESIAEALRDRILASNEDAEYHLPTQDQLVKEFGVSYPSVREAIRILETEGLVTVRRGNVGGAEIHRPDEASAAYHLGLALQGGRVTLGDLAEGLQELEPTCAAACARRADRNETVVPELRANIEASQELVEAGPDFTHTAREFHDIVVAWNPNNTIRYVVGSLVALWSAQEEVWARSQASADRYPSVLDTSEVIKAHRRLLEHIEAGRADKAEQLARAHLVATQRFTIDRFSDGVVAARTTKGRLGDPRSLRSRV